MDETPKFAFEKKIGIHEAVYGDIPTLLNIIEKLLNCIKETNEIHNVKCEFFRLDFRQSHFDEQFSFPLGAFLLDMKWGSQEEIKKLQELKDNEDGKKKSG